MKTIFLIFLLVATSLLAAQPNCTISDSLYQELDAQATQLILNELAAVGIATDSPVEFDATKRTQYIAALFAVHQLENSPTRDTVIDQLRVSPFPFFSTRDIFLIADTTFNWMANLRAGIPSGNQILDSLLTRYGLEVLRYCAWSSLSYDKVIFRSTSPLNMPALAEVFVTAMPYLDFAEPDATSGDGDNIEIISISPEGWRIRYSVGSGDCPAGCIFRRNYDFDVQPECTEFEILQSGGTATQQATILPLAVYPVPFTSEIYLPETIISYTYQLFDAAGRLVQSAGRQSGPIIGLYRLPPGGYLLKISDQDNQIYLSRIVKY